MARTIEFIIKWKQITMSLPNRKVICDGQFKVLETLNMRTNLFDEIYCLIIGIKHKNQRVQVQTQKLLRKLFNKIIVVRIVV